MKTITTNLYLFSELSKKAQEKAINSLCDINVDYEWWDGTYEDAKNIGLQITQFDIYRHIIEGEIIDSGIKTAELILSNHGDKTDTYLLALNFKSDYTALEDSITDDNERDVYFKQSDLTVEFKKALLEEYLSILRKEYEYLTSRDAIVETIEINEYYFTEDGKLS